MNTKTAIENTLRMRDSQSHTYKNAIWETIAFPKAIRNTNIGKENQIPSSEIKSTGKFPVIDQGQPFIAGYSDENDRVIRNDLPLVIFGDHTRVLKFVDFPFMLGGDGTKVLKPCEDLFDARFFYYVLKNLIIPSRGYNRHFTLLKERRLPKPELPEQRKIAAVLGIVQRAIEQQERLLALTAELKKTLLHQLFTRGLRNEPQKQTEIGLIPQSWNLVKLGSLGKVVTGATPKTKVKEYYSSAEIDFIAPFDLGRTRDVYDSERKISRTGLATIRPLPANSVMCVCIGSSTGKVGMTIKGESATNQQINSIICNKAHDPHFVFYLLSYLSSYWRGFATFGPVPILNKGSFEAIMVCVPLKIEEERHIAQVSKALDAKSEVHMRKHAALNDLFRTLLHELMTAKIRVDGIDFDEHTKSYIESGESNVFPQ